MSKVLSDIKVSNQTKKNNKKISKKSVISPVVSKPTKKKAAAKCSVAIDKKKYKKS